ncbi:MAG: AAA family ATPase [Rhodospirillales bacterium]|nr:AAA family ATPase [Rhodospirillales bacterium]MBN8929909.1 AAA family ATPase [Rhodospirillales bacterium]
MDGFPNLDAAKASVSAGGASSRQSSGTTPRDAQGALECLQLPALGKTNIPPRPWAYGHYLLFGQTAVLGAIDGGGKGSMAVAIALAMITGRALLGERVWRTGPVAIVSYEDDQDEWHRRIAAACHHYDVDYEAALDSIRFITRPRDRIVFAALQDGQAVYPDGNNIVVALRELGAALLIIDPFNHAHGFEDGNSNVMIAKVAAEMNRIAWESGAAALVLHHLRKGSTGQADDLMGATSLRATFRSTRILARMTPEEAKPLGVEREAWRYSRIAGSKENYAPPPDKATWFRLESVPLGNGTCEYPEGDTIQVTTTWQPPALFEGIDASAIVRIFDLIREGPGEGESYAPHRQAKRWVGQTITGTTDKSADQAARVIRQWIANGVLFVEKYTHPTRRHEAERVLLNESKAAEIIGQLRGFMAPGDES